MSQPDLCRTTDTDDGLWTLVEQAAGGDAEAFGELYEQTVHRIHTFVYMRTTNKPLTEDITAKVYLRALHGIGTLQRKAGSPIAWLYTIARNLTADYYKSHHVRRCTSVGDLHDLAAAPAAHDRSAGGRDDLSPELDAIASITAEELREAVKRLRKTHQQVIKLRFLDGQTCQETADAIGKSVSCVKVLQYRAVRALRRDPRVMGLVLAQ